MSRIHALRGTRPAARFRGWRRAAIVLAAAGAAAVLTVAVLPHGTKTTSTGTDQTEVTEYTLPTLDLLGSMEKEINQLLSGAG